MLSQFRDRLLSWSFGAVRAEVAKIVKNAGLLLLKLQVRLHLSATGQRKKSSKPCPQTPREAVSPPWAKDAASTGIPEATVPMDKASKSTLGGHLCGDWGRPKGAQGPCRTLSLVVAVAQSKLAYGLFGPNAPKVFAPMSRTDANDLNRFIHHACPRKGRVRSNPDTRGSRRT
jgi:hypothetical protein